MRLRVVVLGVLRLEGESLVQCGGSPVHLRRDARVLSHSTAVAMATFVTWRSRLMATP
jgi:hypothetical protein